MFQAMRSMPSACGLGSCQQPTASEIRPNAVALLALPPALKLGSDAATAVETDKSFHASTARNIARRAGAASTCWRVGQAAGGSGRDCRRGSSVPCPGLSRVASACILPHADQPPAAGACARTLSCREVVQEAAGCQPSAPVGRLSSMQHLFHPLTAALDSPCWSYTYACDAQLWHGFRQAAGGYSEGTGLGGVAPSGANLLTGRSLPPPADSQVDPDATTAARSAL